MPLMSKDEWESETVPETVRRCQDDIRWAEHLFIIYPLWLGDMPALLKAFFEQVARPGFAIPRACTVGGKLLKGRSARVVVTMGMPALIYRFYFGAHSVRSLRWSLLGFAGIRPVRVTLIGMVEVGGEKRRERWLGRLRVLGQDAR